MRTLTKKELKNKLGSFSFFSTERKMTAFNSTYISGIPQLDKLIKEKGLKSVDWDSSFQTRPKGMQVSVLGKGDIGLYMDKINYWSIESQERILATEDKSVVGRAIVGGLLLGGVGAVVGAMSGIKDKQVEKSINGIDNVITLSYTGSDDNEYIMLFSCTDKKKQINVDFFTSTFPDRRKEIEEVSSNATEQPQISVTDELIKLKSLLDAEVLTQEEFDSEKAKLLNR